MWCPYILFKALFQYTPPLKSAICVISYDPLGARQSFVSRLRPCRGRTCDECLALASQLGIELEEEADDCEEDRITKRDKKAETRVIEVRELFRDGAFPVDKVQLFLWCTWPMQKRG